LTKKAQAGISFWNAMYIPIVVAMTSLQDVVAALKGGVLAFAAGVLAVVVAFAFVPVLNRMNTTDDTNFTNIQ
jgi:malonate transporter MadL subunit